MGNWSEQLEEVDFITPFVVEKDCDYYPELEKKFCYVEKTLKKSGLSDQLIIKLHRLNTKLLSIIQDMYKGENLTAQRKMQTIIRDLIKRPMVVTDVNHCMAFQGVNAAISEQEEGEEIINREVDFFKARTNTEILGFERKDMLHIPFDQRSLTSSKRFSIPGLPSIYLATTSYCCWVEMGKPPESMFHVSAFHLSSELAIFNLAVNRSTIQAFEKKATENSIKYRVEEVRETLLKLWMLSIASSCRVKERDRIFKSEYILPQLMMLAVKNYGCDGITYLSKKLRDDTWGTRLNVNVVLFAHYNYEKKYSGICKHMELTDCVNYLEFKELHGIEHNNCNAIFLDGFWDNMYISIAGQYLKYPCTDFYKFDKYLVNREFLRCDVDEWNQ